MDHSHGQLKKEQKYLNFSDMILGWLIPTEKAFCLSLRLSFDLHKQILFLSVWWCWTIEIWPNKQKNHCWSKAHLPCLKKRWEQNDWFNEDFTVNLCSKRHWPVHVYKNHHLIPGAQGSSSWSEAGPPPSVAASMTSLWYKWINPWCYVNI